MVVLLVAALQPLSTYNSDSAPQISFRGWEGPVARARAAAEASLPTLAGGPASARRFAIAAVSPLGHLWAPALLLALSGAGLAGGLIGLRRGDRSRVVFPLFLATDRGHRPGGGLRAGGARGGQPHVHPLSPPRPPCRWGSWAGASPPGPGRCAAPWPSASSRGPRSPCVDHSRVIAEYLRTPPPSPVRELMSYLEGRGFDVGLGDYWAAYPVDYLSGERLRIAARGSRVREYRALLNAERERGVGIVRSRGCREGTRVGGWCVRASPGTRSTFATPWPGRDPERGPRAGVAAAGGQALEPGPGVAGGGTGPGRAPRAVPSRRLLSASEGSGRA